MGNVRLPNYLWDGTSIFLFTCFRLSRISYGSAAIHEDGLIKYFTDSEKSLESTLVGTVNPNWIR
jgi:hypothetical protein